MLWERDCLAPCRNQRRKNAAQMDFFREENRLNFTLTPVFELAFVCIFWGYQRLIFSFDFFFLFKKLCIIRYDTMKNAEDIFSRRRHLLSTLWMKFVTVAPRYLEFRLGGRKITFDLTKVPDLAKYVKNANNCIFASANWSPKD